ncbi:MAG: flavodoxin domain-containing protein [Pseudomonadota bacterium]
MMMTQLPQTPNPLSPEQAQLFGQLLGEISPVQQAWISGYLAATSQSAAFAAPTPAPTAERAPLTILYGSQTGNAKHLAADLAEAARRRDLDVKLVNMADYKPSQLKNEKYITIVTATYGEGEPPEGAQALHAYLASRKAPKLDGVQVAVMGLGDSSYAQFNQTAIDFEARLTALGATVITESALLDVDYDDQAQAWSKTALDKFEPELKANVAQRATNVVQMPGA